MTKARYTVKAAAERAGITPHQLRLWERRFDLIAPERTEGGYRLYGDDDVLVLAYIARRSAEGAVITELAARGRDSLLADAKRWARSARDSATPSAPAQGLRRDDVIELAARGDAAAFERGLDQLAGRMPYSEAVLLIELPLLAVIGERTIAGTLSIAAEHLATTVIRRRLFHHTHGVTAAPEQRPVVLCGAPGDYHEVGLLAAFARLADAKVPAMYLGANLPLAELARVAVEWQPRAVACSLSAPLAARRLASIADGLWRIQDDTGVPVFAAGYEASRQRAVLAERGIVVLRSIDELVRRTLR